MPVSTKIEELFTQYKRHLQIFFHTCHNCQQRHILTSQHYRKLPLTEPQDISLSISLM